MPLISPKIKVETVRLVVLTTISSPSGEEVVQKNLRIDVTGAVPTKSNSLQEALQRGVANLWELTLEDLSRK